MNNGWIKLYRSILDWEWWRDRNTRDLFIYCLIQANHEPTNWRGVTIEKGQFVTTIRSLAYESGLPSVQQTRTALAHLISTHEITQQSTREYSIITINNYDKYQSVVCDDDTAENTEDNNPSTQGQENTPHTPYKEITRRGEDDIPPYNPPAEEKPKRSRKQFTRPTLEEVAAYCQERGNSIDPQHFLDYYDSCGWIVGKNKPMKDWKAAIRNWESRRKQSTPTEQDGNKQNDNNGFRIPSEMERAKSAFKF